MRRQRSVFLRSNFIGPMTRHSPQHELEYGVLEVEISPAGAFSSRFQTVHTQLGLAWLGLAWALERSPEILRRLFSSGDNFCANNDIP